MTMTIRSIAAATAPPMIPPMDPPPGTGSVPPCSPGLTTPLGVEEDVGPAVTGGGSFTVDVAGTMAGVGILVVVVVGVDAIKRRIKYPVYSQVTLTKRLQIISYGMLCK